MVINNVGVELAEQFESRAYPFGTTLEFREYTVSDAQGNETHVTKDGALVGYVDIGPMTHIAVQKTNDKNELVGQPKLIPTPCIANFVEFVRVHPGNETVDGRDYDESQPLDIIDVNGSILIGRGLGVRQSGDEQRLRPVTA